MPLPTPSVKPTIRSKIAVVAPTAAKVLDQEIVQQSRHQQCYRAVEKIFDSKIGKVKLKSEEESDHVSGPLFVFYS